MLQPEIKIDFIVVFEVKCIGNTFLWVVWIEWGRVRSSVKFFLLLSLFLPVPTVIEKK